MYERNQVVPILGFLQAAESHLRPGNVLLGVFQVLKLFAMLTIPSRLCCFEGHCTRVSSFHSIPLALFASVYWKPST